MSERSNHGPLLQAALLAILVYASVCFGSDDASAVAASPLDTPTATNDNAAHPSSANSANAITTRVPPVDNPIPDYLKNCFYAEPELCQQMAAEEASGGRRNQCPCRQYPGAPEAWYCCNITNMAVATTCLNSTKMTKLHMRNVSVSVLDMSSRFQMLTSLAITDGNISRMSYRFFARSAPLRCLNISNNNISEIERSLRNLQSLQFLDISHNNLTVVPNLSLAKNIVIDVAYNKPLNCNLLNEHLLRTGSYHLTFVNPDTSLCVMTSGTNWYTSLEYLSIRQLEWMIAMKSECPVIPGYGSCTCEQDHMIKMLDKPKPYLKMLVNVDCSNLGLIELPERLPQNTFALNISNNSITSLGKHFHDNPTYSNIAKLFANNNRINSISDMEGTVFMDIFLRLYLSNNALTKIPVYFLNNVIDDKGRRIYFGGNKIYCDCNTAKVLKVWLLEHSRDIPDYAEIVCSNLPQRVIDLQEMKICQSPHDWTDYIYYLIGTEVLLLICLIAKVSYDYWVFKTAGYLPWPASKMPKLPCDWLCES